MLIILIRLEIIMCENLIYLLDAAEDLSINLHNLVHLANKSLTEILCPLPAGCRIIIETGECIG